MNTPSHKPWTAALLLSAGAWAAPAQAQEVMARVLSSTAVMQQVAVPRQVCTQQQVIQQSQPSGAGAAMGAIAGGAVGNAIGGGSGRDLATVIGLVGGAVLGNRIEGTREEVRNVQQCQIQTTYENRVLHYDVVYEYDNRRYSIKMPNDPGQFVRLQLNPVGALPAPAAPAPGAPLSLHTPISGAPVAATVIHAPAPLAAVYPATVASPFYAYPAVRPAHRTAVVPVGVSLHWSNVRAHGHGHGHWR